MQIVIALLPRLACLFFAAGTFSGYFARRDNNIFKLAASVYCLAQAYPAAMSFGSLQSASSLQVFSFMAFASAVAAGAVLPFQLKAGQWRVQGLVPQWEPLEEKF